VIAPGQRIEQSAPLLKLARLSTLWVEIAVPASGVRAIRPGARVDVEGYDTPGRVVLVSETTDAATQTVLVRAEVPNTGELRPGQTAAARISFLSPGEAAWEIPYSALIRRGEAASVFVAIEGGFRLVPVTLIAEDQDHVVISGAITNKDAVAISGVSALRGILQGLGTAEGCSNAWSSARCRSGYSCSWPSCSSSAPAPSSCPPCRSMHFPTSRRSR